MLELRWETEDYNKMQAEFNRLDKAALYMSHYDLAMETGILASLWKQFLIEPEVDDYIKSETRFLQQIELRKILQDISGVEKSRSQGLAQIVTALSKTLDATQRKDGPVFIYSYVPLNPAEMGAPNAKVLP